MKKKMKKIKLFNEFFNYDIPDIKLEGKNYSNKLMDYLDSLEWMPQHIKDDLESPDILEIWNKVWIHGLDDNYRLIDLYSPKSIRFYNDIINSLGQESHIVKFYKDINDFQVVLERLYKYCTQSDSAFIQSEILGYCSSNTAALRYLSEDCVKHILANKDLIRTFHMLWRMPTTMQKLHKAVDVKNNDKTWYSNYTTKPFIPTSDQEHEDAIIEIIMKKY
jgi:hypothetical protein